MIQINNSSKNQHWERYSIVQQLNFSIQLSWSRKKTFTRVYTFIYTTHRQTTCYFYLKP